MKVYENKYTLKDSMVSASVSGFKVTWITNPRTRISWKSFEYWFVNIKDGKIGGLVVANKVGVNKIDPNCKVCSVNESYSIISMSIIFLGKCFPFFAALHPIFSLTLKAYKANRPLKLQLFLVKVSIIDLLFLHC